MAWRRPLPPPSTFEAWSTACTAPDGPAGAWSPSQELDVKYVYSYKSMRILEVIYPPILGLEGTIFTVISAVVALLFDYVVKLLETYSVLSRLDRIKVRR